MSELCLNRFYRGKVQKLSTMTLSVDVTALATSTDIKCFIRLTTNGGYTNWLLKCFKSWLISGFPYSSICDILTLLKKVVNFNFGVIKFFCRYMYICTYQDWLFWLITNIFFYWKRKSTGITNLKSKLQQRHTSLTCTFLKSFFLLLFNNSPFLLCLLGIFGWLLLGAFSTGLACFTILISYFNSFLFASLTFSASSTITLLWSTSWASFTSPITVSICNFRFSVTLGKTKTN